MADTTEEILDILKSAYAIEVKGHTFYSTIAQKSDKPAVKELFEKLADDEVVHQKYLKDIAKNFQNQGTAAFRITEKLPDVGAIASNLFNDKFRDQAKGADFEFGAVNIGMTLENGAIVHFKTAAQHSSDQDVRYFYEFLAQWEQGHFDALSRLEETLRQEFWAKSGFNPF